MLLSILLKPFLRSPPPVKPLTSVPMPDPVAVHRIAKGAGLAEILLVDRFPALGSHEPGFRVVLVSADSGSRPMAPQEPASLGVYRDEGGWLCGEGATYEEFASVWRSLRDYAMIVLSEESAPTSRMIAFREWLLAAWISGSIHPEEFDAANDLLRTDP